MRIGLVGSGPAADAVRAACTDIDATVAEATVPELAEFDFGVVIAPAGSDVFRQANDAVDRWIAVEIGGLGGHALTDLDAGVSLFDADSGCYACLHARVASTIDESARDDRATGTRSAVRFAGSVAGREMIALLTGDRAGGTVVEVPGAEREFLPVPGCECGEGQERDLSIEHREASLDDALSRAQRALDDRVGILTETGERESFPAPYYLARIADTTVFSDARAGEYAAGVAAGWDEAFMKALGEALERYSAGVYRSGEFTTAPASNLSRAVSPARFVRPDGYQTPDPEEPIEWVDGIDLASRESVALPAEFVHYPPPQERFKPAITTGLGLGNSTAEAILSGLYEVIERDATMLAWYSTFDPLGLAVEDETFETLANRARAEDLSVTALLVTQDVDVPVVAVAVHRDRERVDEDAWPRFAMGSGADLDTGAAARSALTEALQNWMELRSMGPEAAAQEGGAIADYADFPDPAREFVDVDGSVPAASVGPDDPPTGVDEVTAVVDRLQDADLDAYAARITPRDVAEIEFEGVRAVIPAAQPLFTGDPFFGERARRVPRELGFEPELDRPYHPYP